MLEFLGLSKEAILSLGVLFTTGANELIKAGAKDAYEAVKQVQKRKTMMHLKNGLPTLKIQKFKKKSLAFWLRH